MVAEAPGPLPAMYLRSQECHGSLPWPLSSGLPRAGSSALSPRGTKGRASQASHLAAKDLEGAGGRLRRERMDYPVGSFETRREG